MNHTLVSVHIDTRLPRQPEMWTCSCLQMGERRWFESHLDENKSWPEGGFRQYPKGSADARSGASESE